MKTPQKYGSCHTKRLLSRCKTRLYVTKRHACHAKRSYATFETTKSDRFCRTRHRHGHTDLRTVANVNVTSSEHTLNPQTPRVKREPLLATYLGKKNADFQQSSNSTHEYVQKSIRNIFLKQVLLQ